MKILKKSNFFKSISTLSVGSIFASLITILISPILTRIYTPEELGKYTFLLTAVSLFGSVICARYDVSIVYEKEEEKVYSIIKLSSIIATSLSALIALVYGIYFVLNKYPLIESLSGILFIFIMLLTTGIVKILESYNNRKGEYSLMASVGVIRSVTQNALSVIGGGLRLSVMGLMLSQIIGNIVGVKRQSKSLSPHFGRVKSKTKDDLKKVMVDHKEQPIYSTPAMFANNFSYSSINYFISILFGSATLGVYSISYKVLGLPLSIISRNIGKVFFQEASKEFGEKGYFKSTFDKTFKFVVVLAVPLFIGLYFVVPVLTPAIFGEKWIKSSEIIRLLSPMFTVRFIVTSLSSGFLIIRKQRLDLLLQVIFSISSVAIFIIAKLLDLPLNSFLQLINISFTCVYIVYFTILSFASRKR